MSGSEEFEGSVPPLGEDIPEEDWDAANADGATGTEEDDGDLESYDTEDEDPLPNDDVSLLEISGRQNKAFGAGDYFA